ncbi:helix-turn-helix domain-containing protein [Cronobacter malonaticus]|uniref:helix-turn-helix domain-containing protein n=1 Tax=Cronobacter malonaticus TaxID=413503 RepID=UPI003869096A
MTYREVILCFAFRPPAFFLPSVEESKELVRTLKDFGLTLTNSRIHLLHHMKQTQIPLTASDLSKQIELPLSTTHRTLSTFADCGLVDFIVDRASVCRWYFLFADRPNFCPTCNQIYNAAY